MRWSLWLREYNHGYSGLKHVLDSCLKEYIQQGSRDRSFVTPFGGARRVIQKTRKSPSRECESWGPGRRFFWDR